MTFKRKQADLPVVSRSLRQESTRPKRTPFTADDRFRLARWLAFQRPVNEGRLSHSLYERLRVSPTMGCVPLSLSDVKQYSADDPIYGWASRHTPSAWREHYKKNRVIPWKDGTVLESMIQFNVRHGVDGDLSLETERLKRATNGHVTDGVEYEDKEDSSDAREVEGELLV